MNQRRWKPGRGLIAIVLIVLGALFVFGPTMEAKSGERPLYQLTGAEIDALIREISKTEPEPAERIRRYSQLALGTPYLLYCLGEGEAGKYDRDPLIDFTRVDCMTFCEQILALTISRTYQETFDNLRLIRYHQGIISFETRNHFPLANWLPHNRWLLRDVTREIGGRLCRRMTKIVDFSLPFRPIPGFDQNSYPSPEKRTIHYLPKVHLRKIDKNLAGGEIVIIITAKKGIFASHMGLLVRDLNGLLLFRHASSTKKMVVDEDYPDFCRRLNEDQKIAGVVFARIKETFKK